MKNDRRNVFWQFFCNRSRKKVDGGKQEERTDKKKKKIRIIIGISVLFIYIAAGAVLPYIYQPQISVEYAEQLDVDSFYDEEQSDDRAMIIQDNQDALDVRLQMINQAEKSVLLSTFAFQSDQSGKDMLSALLAAAKRGVEVKILADGFNSWVYMEANPYFYALSSLPQVEIKLYNKVNPLTPWTGMARMHDKYIIVDDTAYILGGRNTFDYFLGDYEGYKNHDWDIFVYDAGDSSGKSSIYQVTAYFEEMWNKKICSIFHDKESIGKRRRVQKAAAELQARAEQMRKDRPDLFISKDYKESTFPVNKITLLSNPTDILPKEPRVFYALTELMKNAEQNVYIHTPYVICNDMMYDSFAQIAAEVPEFELLTNSSVNNGNMFAAGDYLINKDKLLQTGLQILEYEGGISYHGKCIAIDEDMSLVGSFNMDMRSVYLNTELMLAVNSRELNESLRNKMESYEEKAAKVIDEDSYEEKEGLMMKEMPAGRLLLIRVIRFFTGWARFLL